MKKILVLLPTILFTSCHFSAEESLKNVKDVFPHGVICKTSNFTFFVFDSTSNKFFYVEALNMTNNGISSISSLEPISK